MVSQDRRRRHVCIYIGYIKSTKEFENKEVKEIRSSEDTALLRFEEELYNPEFWPNDVGIARFNMDKYKDLLKQDKDFYSTT